MTTNRSPKANLLFVDSDAALSERLTSLFEEQGWSVRRVSGGRAAIEVLAHEPFDLLLLHAVLPDEESAEVIRAIRQAETPARRVSILLLTHPNEVTDRIDGLEAGADNCVIRPFKDRELLALIRAQLRTRRHKQETEWALRRQNRHLAALNEIGRTVGSILDLDQVLQVTMQHIKDTSQVEAGSLILVDDTTGEMIFKVVLQEKEAEQLVGLRLPPGAGVVGHCIEHNEPILVSDVAADARFFPNVDKLSGLTTRSLLCVPLETRDRVVGAIELLNKLDGPFTERDLEFIISMAAFVAIAIDNAQLYAALRDHASILEKEVTNRNSELRAILNSVADGLVVTGADDRVLMVNPAARKWLNLKEGPGLQAEKANIQWRAIQGLARVSEGDRTVEIDVPVPQPNREQTCFEWFACTADCPARSAVIESTACWLVPDTLCPQSHPQGFTGDITDYCLACEFYQRQQKITLQAHSAQIHDQENQPVGEVTVLRDITRLKELDRLKSQFVSNVSHELKTPLGNLKLYLSLLEKGRAEKRERYLQVLNQEVKLLEGLITDLLDLSRLDTDRVRSDKIALSLNHTVERALDSLMTSAAEKNLDLQTVTSAVLPPALADESQIHQVITNLVTNAINYTPNGGTVEVATGLWQRGSEGWRVVGDLPTPEQIDVEPPEATWVVLSVSDTGKGISEVDLPRLFERFFRGEAERSDVPGTGLGLAIVKEIVDHHKGHVFVHSQPGRGATFVVLLPLFREARRPLVLIAEDQEDIHTALETFLEWAEMDADHAFDGQEALDRVQDRRPDLLLLDLNMPRLDGYQVIQALRADESTKDLPILVLTSWAHDRAEKALDLGANEFLTKPFSGDVLIDVIRRLLNQ